MSRRGGIATDTAREVDLTNVMIPSLARLSVDIGARTKTTKRVILPVSDEDLRRRRIRRELLSQTQAELMANETSLDKLSEDQRNNEYIVLTAVRQEGVQLQFASEQLRNSARVVAVAATNNVHALQYADPQLLSDPNFMLRVIHINPESMKYAASALREEMSFVEEAVKLNAPSFVWIDKRLQSDMNLIAFASRGMGRDVLKYVHNDDNKLLVMNYILHYRLHMNRVTMHDQLSDDVLRRDEDAAYEYEYLMRAQTAALPKSVARAPDSRRGFDEWREFGPNDSLEERLHQVQGQFARRNGEAIYVSKLAISFHDNHGRGLGANELSFASVRALQRSDRFLVYSTPEEGTVFACSFTVRSEKEAFEKGVRWKWGQGQQFEFLDTVFSTFRGGGRDAMRSLLTHASERGIANVVLCALPSNVFFYQKTAHAQFINRESGEAVDVSDIGSQYEGELLVPMPRDTVAGFD